MLLQIRLETTVVASKQTMAKKYCKIIYYIKEYIKLFLEVKFLWDLGRPKNKVSFGGFSLQTLIFTILGLKQKLGSVFRAQKTKVLI